MVYYYNTAEGQASGTTLTTGNSGGNSGSAFYAVQGTVLFSNTQKKFGSNAYLVNAAAGADSYFYWRNTTGDTSASLRAYVYFTAFPTGAQLSLLQLRTSVGAIANIGITTSGNLYVTESGFATLATSASAISLNTWYRLELSAIVGTTTTNGTVQAGVYVGDSTSPTVLSYSNAARNTGTVNIIEMRFGKLTQATAAIGNTYFDNIAADLGSSSLLGPSVAPTVTTGSSSSITTSGGTVAGTVNDNGLPTTWVVHYGTTTSYGSTASGGTSAGAITPYSVSKALTGLSGGTTYHYRISATNDVGTTNGSDGSFTTLSTPTDSVRPVSLDSAGAWTAVGAGNLYDTLADESDSTYNSLTVSSTENAHRVKLGNMNTGDILLKVKLAVSASGTPVDAVVRLYEGTTLRASFTVADVASTPTTYTYLLSPTERDSIGDRSNLHLEIGGVLG